jgi:hypothetical protein
VVYHATTSPIDSVHRARALGLSLQELRDQQPQIFAMLKTEFRAAIVGFQRSQEAIAPTSTKSKNGSTKPIGTMNGTITGTIYQHLPPRPPQIHQAVHYCDPEQVIQFSENLDFLRTLLQVNGAPVEGLAAAAIREIYQLRKGDRAWLVQVGRMLSLLLKDDYDRLRVILSQIYL